MSNLTDFIKTDLSELSRKITTSGVHGLARLDVVSPITGGWAKATIASMSNTGFAVVTNVINENDIDLAVSDFHTIESHGLEIDQKYYLSSTVPGLLSLTQTGENQPILKVLDDNNILIFPFQLAVSTSSASTGGLDCGTASSENTTSLDGGTAANS